MHARQRFVTYFFIRLTFALGKRLETFFPNTPHSKCFPRTRELSKVLSCYQVEILPLLIDEDIFTHTPVTVHFSIRLHAPNDQNQSDEKEQEVTLMVQVKKQLKKGATNKKQSFELCWGEFYRTKLDMGGINV